MTNVYERLGVAPAINACGIYTDLGGSVLSSAAWKAATEANASWASIPELLASSGARIAELCGAEAARVTPGAAAGIALATAACIARGDGPANEALPSTGERPAGVLIQRAHRYKYERCARLAGAELIEVGSDSGTRPEDLEAAIAGGSGTVAILHAAHLDAERGALPLAEVAAIAAADAVPVIVDAAYMSYPTELISSYTSAGADLVCFSAKYFHGPNAGGFVLGRSELIEAIAAVDFTEFESGSWRSFGRALKMDRSTIVATVVALEEWLALDHEERWCDYERRIARIEHELAGPAGVVVEARQFTLDERIVEERPNALVLRSRAEGSSAAQLAATLAAGSPPVLCIVADDALVACVETVPPEADDLLVAALQHALGRAAVTA